MAEPASRLKRRRGAGALASVRRRLPRLLAVAVFLLLQGVIARELQGRPAAGGAGVGLGMFGLAAGAGLALRAPGRESLRRTRALRRAAARARSALARNP